MITIKKFIQINQAIESFKEDENRLTFELVKIINDGKDLPINEAQLLINDTLHELQLEKPFTQRFTLNGIEFGFHPNLDKLTVGEWIDLDNYQKDMVFNANKILSILYRPITKRIKDLYEIEDYDGTKYGEIMLEADAAIFNGMMVFFWSLSKELIQGSDTYIQNQMMTLMSQKSQLKED